MRRLIAVLIFVLVSVPASGANYMNGNHLYDDLQKARSANASYGEGLGTGYILGIVDSEGDGSGPTWKFCIPGNVTVGQLLDVVKNWLQQHPEVRHYAARGLVGAALSEAFPCPKPQDAPPK